MDVWWWIRKTLRQIMDVWWWIMKTLRPLGYSCHPRNMQQYVAPG